MPAASGAGFRRGPDGRTSAGTPIVTGGADAAFTPTAMRLAGLATLLLGWTPDQFWAATPAELAAILSACAALHSDRTADNPPDADTMARLMEMFPDG